MKSFLSRHTERLLLAALAIAAALARWATRTPVVYNWDSIHYVLAQDDYDLAKHQPHPPGSYYYVRIAAVLRLLSGDAHTALLLLSALSGAAAVLLLFRLASELFPDRPAAGWVAAATAASAPLFWFYGSVGLNYGPAGVLSAWLALGCVRLVRGREPVRSAWQAGVALGLLGGFRPTDAAFLAPAFGAALTAAARRRSGERLPASALAGSLLAAAVLTAGWLGPSCQNVGGPSRYAEAVRAQGHLFARTSVLLAGRPAWNEALLTHRRSLESTLGIGWLLLLPAIATCAIRRRPGVAAERPGRDPAWTLGALLVLPAFAFYLLGHFNSPGYTHVYAGFLAAAAAGPIAVLADSAPPGRRSAVLIALVSAVLAGNSVLFLAGWPGSAGLAQRSLSYAEIQDHARYYRELRAFLLARHAPGEVRVLASPASTDGLRVVQSLLPEHAGDVAQLVRELPELPPILQELSFLRLVTPERLRVEGRPVYAVARTREDLPYHLGLFRTGWEAVPIGPGHRVWQLRLERAR